MDKITKTQIEEILKTSKKLYKQTYDYLDSPKMNYYDSTTYKNFITNIECVIGNLTMKLEENKEEE